MILKSSFPSNTPKQKGKRVRRKKLGPYYYRSIIPRTSKEYYPHKTMRLPTAFGMWMIKRRRVAERHPPPRTMAIPHRVLARSAPRANEPALDVEKHRVRRHANAHDPRQTQQQATSQTCEDYGQCRPPQSHSWTWSSTMNADAVPRRNWHRNECARQPLQGSAGSPRACWRHPIVLRRVRHAAPPERSLPRRYRWCCCSLHVNYQSYCDYCLHGRHSQAMGPAVVARVGGHWQPVETICRAGRAEAGWRRTRRGRFAAVVVARGSQGSETKSCCAGIVRLRRVFGGSWPRNWQRLGYWEVIRRRHTHCYYSSCGCTCDFGLSVR